MADCFCLERQDCQAPQSGHLHLQIHQLVRFLGQLLLPLFLPPLPLEPQLEVLGVLSWVELAVAQTRVYALETTEHTVSACTVSGVDHLSRPFVREETLLFPLRLFLNVVLFLYSKLSCLCSPAWCVCSLLFLFCLLFLSSRSWFSRQSCTTHSVALCCLPSVLPLVLLHPAVFLQLRHLPCVSACEATCSFQS